ncbi:MAG: hypothetical protein GY859_22565 [Desulfobacterales bacterium]|nr:hypothetical protein [Desulfobacterales bacterium]
MDDDKEYKLAVKRFHDLAAQRDEILALPPERALDRILSAPNPAPLVHSFPEQDLHFLIHDIGPEDAVPLLGLASDRQWEYMVDVETWEKDKVSMPAATRWLHLLQGADPMRFINWFLKEKTEFVELYLYRSMEIRLREHDQDPADFGKGFFTLDGTLYIRLFDAHPAMTLITESTDGPDEEAPGDFLAHQRQEFIQTFLKNLAALDHPTYQKAVIETMHMIPSEIEEETLGMRNARLAEKGFLPFDEAVGVYQPLDPDQAPPERKTRPPVRTPGDALSSPPRYPTRMLDADDFVTRALMEMDADGIPDDLQLEFAVLCNRVASADGKAINNQEQLKKIVGKVSGFIRVGVDALVGAHGGAQGGAAPDERATADASQCAAMMRGRPLADLFRVGWGRVLKLKWRTEKWLRTSWFKSAGLPLTFWDEAWTGVLGGLLIKKPLCFDNYKSGELYREFSATREINEARDVLDNVIAFDDLLSLMTPSFGRPLSDYGFITYKNLLLTPWARHLSTPGELETEPVLTPLRMEEFKRFFRDLFQDPTGETVGNGREIRVEMKTSFLDWLAATTGLTGDEISGRMGGLLETLFEEIEDELGRVPEANLDPKWIHLFLIE